MSAINFTINSMVTLINLINNGGSGDFSCVSTNMDLKSAWDSMETLQTEGLIEFPNNGAIGSITPKGREACALMRAVYSF